MSWSLLGVEGFFHLIFLSTTNDILDLSGLLVTRSFTYLFVLA